MRVAILTDSTAYMPKELRKQLDIHMIPLNVIFGEESYQDEIEISIEEFYKKVKTTEKLPTTSQPATGIFVERYEELAKDYDAVISIHISSGLSGTYQGAVAASEIAEGIDVHVFDSEIACGPQAFYVEEAAKMALAGKGVTEILRRLEEMKESLRTYFVVEDLMHLQRGGRLSSAQALIGSFLQMKPILHVENTLVVPFEKIRTFKRAKKRIIDLCSAGAAKGKAMKAVVIHANVPEQAEEIKKEIESKHANVEVEIGEVGPVVGAHLGEGTVGLGWYVK